MINSHQSFSNILDLVKRTHSLRLFIYILVAVAIRVILYHKLPILLTADSWDYLSSAKSIFESLDFYNGLRDWRLPGYPVFLAITWPLTKMQSNYIVMLQSLIGLASVLLGLAIGRLLRSRLLTEGLVLFLSINPAYLLFEHLLLTETLYLFSSLCFILITVLCLRWKMNWITGAMLGLTVALSVLIRINGLPLYAIVIIGLFFMKCMTVKPRFRIVALKRLIGFALAGVLVAGAVLSPWLWRNYRLYHTISLTNNNNRNLIIYKSMHGHLDPTLPKISAISRKIEVNQIDFNWYSRLTIYFTTTEAEKLAKDAYIEQIKSHPIIHLQDIGESFACLIGVSPGGGGRLEVRYWFTNIITQEVVVNQLNEQAWELVNPDFRYVNTGIDVPFLQYWGRIGNYYLLYFRPVMSILLFILVCLYFGFFRRRSLTIQENMALLLSIGYFAIIASHSVTLADVDRLPIPFDATAIMIILLLSPLISCPNWNILECWKTAAGGR